MCSSTTMKLLKKNQNKVLFLQKKIEMPYKYEDKIIEIETKIKCICFEDYIEKDCEAYRFTFDDITNDKNFLPTAFDRTNDGARRRCTGYAVSLHETENASIEAWHYFIDDKPNKVKKLGTHIAKGNITKKLGKCSESDAKLHFNFAEYNDVDLSSVFKIHRQVATQEMIDTINLQ